jgi:glycosyltransferase involved in cell wall biosynthesis
MALGGRIPGERIPERQRNPKTLPKVVALVSSVNPFPADAGKKVVLAGLLTYLANRVGSSNVHYLMVRGSPVSGFPVHLHSLPKPIASSAIGRVLTHTLSGRSSLQEAMLGSDTLRRAIDHALCAASADLEIYDTVRMAQHARPRPAAQMCYLDDLFSERYRAMLRAAARYPDLDLQPLGNFATYIPTQLRPIADHPRGQRLLLRLEQRLVAHSEARVVEHFDRAILVSEKEAALLRQRCGASTDRVTSIPPLISRRFARPRDYRGDPEFIFLGLLSLPHNDDGLRTFLAEVWPRVLAAQPKARLRVVGRDPRCLLSNAVAKYADSVSLEGYVQDLGEVLSRTAAMVNPLRFGSGVKLKVIEALGGGVPVVSTGLGAEGLRIGPDYGILQADRADLFAETLLEIVDPGRNEQLSQAAAAHFTTHFSRDAVFAKYDNVFGLG